MSERLPTASRGSLDALLAPASVAFIGVSPDPMKYSGRALRFLTEHGFSGRVYAVNPKYTEVLGVPCVGNVDDLPDGEVDLAFVAVSADRVSGVVAKCGRKGIRAAIIASSGFREAGNEGAERERELQAVGRDSGVRLCGPNCIGVANMGQQIVLSFGTAFERPVPSGPVAILSQSGAFASNLVDSLRRRGIGVSYMVSSGNEADLTTGEYLSFLVHDPSTRAILVYMEGMRHAPSFFAAAEDALALGKPIVLLKTGQSSASQRAILSHTGSLAGDREMEVAAFGRYGVVAVNSIEDMVEMAMLAARAPSSFTPGRNVGIVCIGSGGATSLAADLLEEAGLAIATLSSESTQRLEKILPSFVTPQNPLDVAGTSFEDEARLAGDTLAVFAADPSFEKLVAVVPGLPHVDACVDAVRRIADGSPKSVIAVFCGGPYTDQGVERAVDGGLAWSYDLERVGRALRAATEYAAVEPPGQPFVGGHASTGESKERVVMDEYEAKVLLASFGVPTARELVVDTLEEAIDAARSVGYPVVLKVNHPALTHKSDAGGVVLGIGSDQALSTAYSQLTARMTGELPDGARSRYLVQQMVSDGVEVFIGIKNDVTYGPAILLGPGGVLVEMVREVAVELLPIRREDVRRLLGKTRLAQLLRGVRGRPAVNEDALIETVLRLGDFSLKYRESLVEVDINPVIVRVDDATVVDALIVWNGSSSNRA